MGSVLRKRGDVLLRKDASRKGKGMRRSEELPAMEGMTSLLLL